MNIPYSLVPGRLYSEYYLAKEPHNSHVMQQYFVIFYFIQFFNIDKEINYSIIMYYVFRLIILKRAVRSQHLSLSLRVIIVFNVCVSNDNLIEK